MYPVILTVHILVGVLLIFSVLIQSGRSGGFSNLMGGGGGDALFSTSGQQSGVRKITIVLAGVFMVTSLSLTLLSARKTNRSVFQRSYPALPPVDMPQTTQESLPVSSTVGDQPLASTPQKLDSEPVKK